MNTKLFLIMSVMMAVLLLPQTVSATYPANFGSCAGQCSNLKNACYDDCYILPTDEQVACLNTCDAAYDSCLYNCEYTYGFCEDIGYVPCMGDCGTYCEDQGYIYSDDCPDCPSSAGGCPTCTDTGEIITTTTGTFTGYCCFSPLPTCLLIMIFSVAIVTLVALDILSRTKKHKKRQKKKTNNKMMFIVIGSAIASLIILILFVLPLLGLCCENLPIDPCWSLILLIIILIVVIAYIVMSKRKTPKRKR